MKTKQTNNEVQESTYALLVRSEDRERSILEAIAYGLFILSAVTAIGQFALQPAPVSSGIRTVSAARIVSAHS